MFTLGILGFLEKLKGINYSIKHLFREGNHVAKWLARHARVEILVGLLILESFLNGLEAQSA